MRTCTLWWTKFFYTRETSRTEKHSTTMGRFRSILCLTPSAYHLSYLSIVVLAAVVWFIYQSVVKLQHDVTQANLAARISEKKMLETLQRFKDEDEVDLLHRARCTPPTTVFVQSSAPPPRPSPTAIRVLEEDATKQDGDDDDNGTKKGAHAPPVVLALSSTPKPVSSPPPPVGAAAAAPTCPSPPPPQSPPPASVVGVAKKTTPVRRRANQKAAATTKERDAEKEIVLCDESLT